jgi:hypothetical protein
MNRDRKYVNSDITGCEDVSLGDDCPKSQPHIQGDQNFSYTTVITSSLAENTY